MSDMYMWIDVAAVLLLSVVCAGVLIPRILLISFRKRLFDRPDERKIHQCIVPRLGGIAFVPVIMRALKYHMEHCVNDIDWLNSVTKRSQKGTQLGNEIEEFTKQAKELNDLITMYDEDDFEDVDFDD